MKKGILLYAAFFISILNVYSQSFDAIIDHFKRQFPPQDSVKPPLVFKGTEFNVAISDNPISFDIKEVVLNGINEEDYPISFSVIFQDKLISLFKSGSFICHSVPSMEKDEMFEKKLNTKKFQYHWIIEDKLIGLSKGTYYYFDSNNNKWVKYSEIVPMKQQSKLFEDNSYISFGDCHGEWGGAVYFYDKISNKTHFTEATCANSVLKEDSKYYVLSHLGHGLGSSELKEISFPNQLPQVNLKNVNKTVNGQALGYTDKSNITRKIFDYYDIQIFSSFIYQNRTLYMIFWKDATFFAEIKNNVIEIVNPLFNRELYTHDPITSLYGDVILINMDFYGIAKEQEVSCIMIKDSQLIKVDWNEKHNN